MGYLQCCLGTEAKGVKMFQAVYSALHVAAVDPHIGCLGGHSSESWGDRWREGVRGWVKGSEGEGWMGGLIRSKGGEGRWR